MPTFDIAPETPGLFTRDDYYDLLAALRRDAPVYEYEPGSWTIARYDDVRDVSRDPARFCSAGGAHERSAPKRGRDPRLDPAHGPADHAGPAQARQSPVHAPRATADLEPDRCARRSHVLDESRSGETVDFVDRVAAPFPCSSSPSCSGIADADRDDFRRWSDAAISSPTDTPARTTSPRSSSGTSSITFATRAATGRRRCVGARDRRDRRATVSTAEAVGYCLALLVAGNETTRHLVSGTALALSGAPRSTPPARAEPDASRTAVEECLRWVTPIQAFGRTVTRDTELGGRRLREGDWVVLLYASANRDERSSARRPTAST